MTKDIMRLANPHCIKYIQCKNCKLNYEAEIATEPCAKCGGYDFEQFDLILHKMTLQNNKRNKKKPIKYTNFHKGIDGCD